MLHFGLLYIGIIFFFNRVKELAIYFYFPKCFYQEWIVAFDKCLLIIHWDDHIFFLCGHINMVDCINRVPNSESLSPPPPTTLSGSISNRAAKRQPPPRSPGCSRSSPGRSAYRWGSQAEPLEMNLRRSWCLTDRITCPGYRHELYLAHVE